MPQLAAGSQKVLLVNYAGYWVTGNTFVADSALAGMAGTLVSHDVGVEVMDVQNPIDMGKIIGPVGRVLGGDILSALGSGQVLGDALLTAYFHERRQGQDAFEDSIFDEISQKVDSGEVGLVAFRVWAGNGAQGTIGWAEKLKKRFPKLPLVAGGPAVSYAQDRFSELTTAFDHVVLRNGEQALLNMAHGNYVDVADTIHLGRAPTNRGPLRPDLNALSPPVYDAHIYRQVNSLYHMRIIDDSRGCPYRCAFCSHPTMAGGKMSMKSATRVVDEMQMALNTDGIRYFRLAGSNPPWKFLKAVGKEIVARGLDLRYAAFSSMNNAKSIDFPMMHASGLQALLFGVESGDPEFLLKVHNKRNGSVEHVVDTAQRAMDAGIFICLSLIVPSPLESEASKQATLNLLRRIFERHNLGAVVVFPPMLAPGSTWWKNREAYGFEFSEGTSELAYMQELLHSEWNFLLPSTANKPVHVKMGGRDYASVLAESTAFTQEVEKLGIVTNLDDAAYMIGHLGQMSAAEYKGQVRSALVLGGEQNLMNIVNRVNEGGAMKVAASG